MVPATKGLSFQRVLQFAEQEFGQDGPQRLLDDVPEADRQVLVAMVPVGWYPLALYAVFLRVLVRVHGQGRLSMLEDYGRFAAKRDIGSIYKLLFKITSPGLIFDQAMKLWDRFHNTGTWRVERRDRGATGTLSDWGCVDEALCRELVGYLEAMLAHGRCSGVRVEHPKCRAHGAPACVFTCTWQ